MSKRVAIVQSSYIPWKGYFDLIREVDEFIFLDQVQFTTRDWRTRNRIKTAQGPQWLSIPAGDNRSRRVCDVLLPNPAWQSLHWERLRHSYVKAPFFRYYKPFFEDLYLGRSWPTLSQFNQAMIEAISTDLLGLQTRFIDSLAYNAVGAKLDLIMDLLVRSHATSYLSGPSAGSYLDSARFQQENIKLTIKKYNYPEYEQLYPPFVHEVSIIDLLFMTGPKASYYIWGFKHEWAK